MKDKKILFGTFISLLVLLTTGLSYAYFSTSVSGNNDAKDVVVETGTLKLVYTDSPEIVAEHIKPGWSTTKVVTVKNTGTLDVSYNLVWQELTNEITNNELVISASCERLNSSNAVEGTCESIIESPVGSNKIKKNISIESGITHKYTFTITFKEMNQGQDYNQNKKFNGVIGVEEYKDTAVYCTFDGNLKQGTEYVNGQYTYRYMQEAREYGNWTNIDQDGWGVALTDSNSTEPVTSKLCTYINNKPVITTAYTYNYSKASSIDLSNNDTSNITNMSNMFMGSSATSINLSDIDTSNVTNMSGMFNRSQATTLDVNHFDTSKVTNMSGMFDNSKATTLDVSHFDTSKVTNMSGMFDNSKATTLDVSHFDTSKVTNMSDMFYNSKATTLDVSHFDTSKVTNMNSMFAESQATTLDVSHFDTSNVTEMGGMFSNSKATTLDVSHFDTSNVTGMGSMFSNSRVTILDLSHFDTSKVTSMYAMFRNLKVNSLDISNFNTSNVTNMSDMFSGSQATTIDVSNFDTSNVTGMSSMFSGISATSIKGLETFNTSEVTDMSYMFDNFLGTTLDLSSFDTNKVTKMFAMFYKAENLSKIYASDKFVTDNVINSTNMFHRCLNLSGYNSSYVDKTFARISGNGVTGYFTAK